MILIPKYHNQIQLVGSLSILVFDENGKLKDERYVPNTVVDTGRAYIASRIIGTSATQMDFMAIGTGTTAVATSQTALVTELSGSGYARQSSTRTNPTSTVAQFVATFGANVPTTSPAVTEAGIFDAASAGNMLCRTVFAAVNKAAADSLTITWQITVN